MSYRDPYARAFEQIGQYLAQAAQGYGGYLTEQRREKEREQEQQDLIDIARAQGIQQQNLPLYNLALQNLQGFTVGTPEYENALRLFQSYQPLFAPATTAEEARAIVQGFGGLSGQRVTPMAAVPTDEFAAGGFLGTPAPAGPPRVEQVAPIEQLLGQSQAIGRAAAEREAATAAAASFSERVIGLQENIVSELSPEARGKIAQTEDGRRLLATLDSFESLAATNPGAVTPDMLYNAQAAFSQARTAAGFTATTASPFMLQFGQDLLDNWSDYGIAPAASVPLASALSVLSSPSATPEQVAEAEGTIVDIAGQVGIANARALLTSDAQGLLGTLRGFATKTTDAVQLRTLEDSIKTITQFISGGDVEVADYIDAQARGLRIGAAIGESEAVRANAVATVDSVVANWDNLSTAERLSQYQHLAEKGVLDYLTPEQRASYEALTGIEDIPGIAERDREVIAEAYANAWDAYENGLFGMVEDEVGLAALREILGVGPDENLDVAMQARRNEIFAERELQRQKDAVEFARTAIGFENDRNGLIADAAATYSPEQLQEMANKRPENPVRAAAWDVMGRDGWNAAIAAAEARVLSNAFDDPNAQAAYDYALTLTRERPDTPEGRAAVLDALGGTLDQTALSDPVKNAIYNSVANVFAGMDAGLEVRNAEALLASDVARAMVANGFNPGYDATDYLRLNDALIDDLNVREELLRQNECIAVSDQFGVVTRGANADSDACRNLRLGYNQIASRVSANNTAMQQSSILQNYFVVTDTLPNGTVIRRVDLRYEDGTAFEPQVIQRLMGYALETINGRYPTLEEMQGIARAFSVGEIRLAPDGTLVNRDGIPIATEEPQGSGIAIQNVDDNPELSVAGERDTDGNLPPVTVDVPIELQLSGIVESSNRPDAVNRNEGTYGTYQFSSVGGFDRSGLGSFLRFLNDSEPTALARLAGFLGLSPNASTQDVYNALTPSDGPVSDGVVNAWSNFARSGDYGRLERSHVMNSYVEPAREFLNGLNVDLDRVSTGLMQVMTDTNIQHGVGGAETIFARAVDSLGVPEEEFVGWLQIPGNDRVLAQAIMDERFKDNEEGSLFYFTRAIASGDYTKEQLLNRYTRITSEFDNLSWYSPSQAEQIGAASARAIAGIGGFLGQGLGNLGEGARGAGGIVAGAAEAFGEAGAGALAAAPGAVANLFAPREPAPAPSVSPLFGRRTTGGRGRTSERLRSDE